MRFLAHQVSKLTKSILNLPEHLGKKIAEKGYNLVFGAGKYGIMGASARGVIQRRLATQSELHPYFFYLMWVLFLNKCSEL